MSREDLRQAIHAAMCAWSLLFPWIGKGGAIALGAVAVLFNALVFPRLPIGRSLVREGERRWTGVQWYPVAVLGLVLSLPLGLAAGSWGVLGAGDAASNLFGRRWGRSKLPWNRGKSWVGTISFFAVAAPVSWSLMLWFEFHGAGGARSGPLVPLLYLALLGSAAGALVETIPWRIDDNLAVAAASGLAMALGNLVLLAPH